MIINIYNSKILGNILFSLYSLSIVLVWCLPLTITQQVLLSILVALSAAYSLRSHGFGRAEALLHSIRFNKNNQIEARWAGDTDWYRCEVANSVIWRWLIIASVTIDGQRRSRRLLIPVDTISPSDYRYMCTWFKYGQKLRAS